MTRFAAFLAFLCLAPPVTADRFVDDDNSSDTANDCTGQATPCATIEHALNEAGAGETVHIAAGTYTEALTIDQDIALQGAGADASSGTVIQAATAPDPANERVITVDPDASPQPKVTLSGLVIRHGAALGGFPDDRGGGFYADGATVEIRDVLFADNAGREGGALFQFRGQLTVTGVTFGPGNHADFGGGGMRTFDTPAQLIDVTFTNNTSDINGGGLFLEGEKPELKNVIFNGNTATGDGGGLYLSLIDESLIHPTVVNALFHGNDAANGGAVAVSNCELSLRNTTIGGNAAQKTGGGVYSTNFTDLKLNLIIAWGNEAGAGAQLSNDENSSLSLTRSLYGNQPGDVEEGGSFTATDTSNEDPLFVNAESDNFRLMQGSPAIDTAVIGAATTVFPTDEQGNMIDLDGNPRFAGGGLDMGAYEFQPPATIFRDRFEQLAP